ncbi:MAG: squalene/phytoene synthase family protein [Planctomycetes bacterium]|jgi:farnesyl-diphosphate farnesyltransferase|nr:squalene/phytoene synthase family protein [Planctomycetota bacterium]HPY74817.1 squalene/phytoene synthase family protein [Planctomycetota bacterium]HQB00457.1 squalene/phytoene synthase family protein [Planctomycetota bacterium]
MIDESKQYCEDMLPLVSRTFAIGIEALDKPLTTQIGVGYLICRILDTLEDTNQADTNMRIQLLERAAIELCTSQRDSLLSAFNNNFPKDQYQGNDIDLLHGTHKVMEVYDTFPENIQDAIKECVRKMAQGMAKTIAREKNHKLQGLTDLPDLDQYCYYVAGTVGEFLTKAFADSRESITPKIQKQMQEREIDFALGLQLTNILKGILGDNERGVIYLPRTVLQKHNINIENFLQDSIDERYESMVHDMIQYILPYLDRSIEYTLLIPEQETDIRIFCTLPVLFALRTIHLAQTKTMDLLLGMPLKITRKEVKELHIQADKAVDDNGALQKLFQRERNNIKDKTI